MAVNSLAFGAGRTLELPWHSICGWRSRWNAIRDPGSIASDWDRGHWEARAEPWQNVRVSRKSSKPRAKAGRPTPADEPSAAEEAGRREAAVEDPRPKPSPAAAPAPPANVPTPASDLGRPLTLKEKLAAARAGGATPPAAAPAAPKPRRRPPSEADERGTGRGAQGRASAGQASGPADDPAGEAGGAPRGGRVRPGRAPARAKPAAAKAAPRPPRRPRPARCPRSARSPTPRTSPRPPARPPPRRPRRARRQGGRGRARQGQAKAGPPSPRPFPPGRAASWPPRRTGLDRVDVNRRGFFLGSLFVSWIAVAWTTFTAGAGRHDDHDVRPVHVPQRARRAAQHHQDRPAHELRARGSQRALQGRVGLLDRPVHASTTGRISSTRSSRSARTWAARPTGWPASRNSSARATAAASTSPGSTSKGPAPRPLERFKVALADDGQIMVDKSQKFQQELGQWSDPDSFIPA